MRNMLRAGAMAICVVAINIETTLAAEEIWLRCTYPDGDVEIYFISEEQSTLQKYDEPGQTLSTPVTARIQNDTIHAAWGTGDWVAINRVTGAVDMALMNKVYRGACGKTNPRPLRKRIF